jgi:hypothetical protein
MMISSDRCMKRRDCGVSWGAKNILAQLRSKCSSAEEAVTPNSTP